MRFSVVMQCFLGPYKGAASNREEKLIRAVDSILNQSFQDFEVIVVADGCNKTYDLIFSKYEHDNRVECILIGKQPLWSGRARNYGIDHAKGGYVVYLDADDKWGVDHLKKIDEQLEDHNWVYFNDIVLNKRGEKIERECFIDQRFHNGTSNICHKRSLAVRWNGSSYGLDDWSIVKSLNNYKGVKINTPEYFVCHIPLKLDV